jgi:hypothetical protein
MQGMMLSSRGQSPQLQILQPEGTAPSKPLQCDVLYKSKNLLGTIAFHVVNQILFH